MDKKTTYGTQYFETVTTEPGCNRLRENTCEIIDFNLLILASGETYCFNTESREYGLVILKGTVDITLDGQAYKNVGGRNSVFTERPSGAYAGCGCEVEIKAHDPVEVALGSAPSSTPIKPYLIPADQTEAGGWGDGKTLRNYRYLINAHRPSERLWLAEVVVRDGRWATYPPHKHEDVPEDLFQEEMYYYRVEPAEGFGFCGQFGGLVGSDYAFMIRNNTIHKMPHGYHTVTAAPGYQVYYLAIYAGRDKGHKPSPHPDHFNYAENPMPDPFI